MLKRETIYAKRTKLHGFRKKKNGSYILFDYVPDVKKRVGDVDLGNNNKKPIDTYRH